MNDDCISTKMKTGRIVQFWRDWSTIGHRPLALLNSFLCVNLVEPYLPYNVLLNRMQNLMVIKDNKHVLQTPLYAFLYHF